MKERWFILHRDADTSTMVSSAEEFPSKSAALSRMSGYAKKHEDSRFWRGEIWSVRDYQLIGVNDEGIIL